MTQIKEPKGAVFIIEETKITWEDKDAMSKFIGSYKNKLEPRKSNYKNEQEINAE